MLSNIKLIGVIVLSVLLLTNCKKEDKIVDSGQGEVVFTPNQSTNIDKSDGSNCELPASYAFVVVNGMDYNLPVFYINEMITTQALKLDAGDYTLEEFVLMYDNETPDLIDDDIPVMASVNENGEFESYVDFTLPYEFTVEAFIKIDQYVEVICYFPEFFYSYGFEFFTVWVTEIHEWFFFGDLCLKAPYEYQGSLYAEQSQGLQVDVPAIFYIDVYRGEEFLSSFSNVSFLGEGEALKVTYADRQGIPDVYTWKMYTLVKVANDFEFVFFKEWNFTDVADMETGGDGITDFVIGNCVYSNTDLLLPPWMNLPSNVTYDCIHPGENSYFDITLSDIGPGYDIWNGDYEGWCADLYNDIDPQQYVMDAKSSLYPENLPGEWKFKGDELNACNWLFNNLDDYEYTSDQMQDALWCIFDGIPCQDATSALMADDALEHTDYSPLPGGWAAVLFFDVDDNPFLDSEHTQITFFTVDP